MSSRLPTLTALAVAGVVAITLAGCSSSAPVAASPNARVDPPAASTPSASAPVPSGWVQVDDAEFGYSFRHPEGYEEVPGQQEGGVFLFGESGTISVAVLPAKEGTTLADVDAFVRKTSTASARDLGGRTRMSEAVDGFLGGQPARQVSWTVTDPSGLVLRFTQRHALYDGKIYAFTLNSTAEPFPSETFQEIFETFAFDPASQLSGEPA